MPVRSTLASGRRRRKTITVLWLSALAIVIVSLIYWEMTALLYIFATLGVTILLVVVARADLGGAEKVSQDIASGNDTAATGSSRSSTYATKQS